MELEILQYRAIIDRLDAENKRLRAVLKASDTTFASLGYNIDYPARQRIAAAITASSPAPALPPITADHNQANS